MCRATDEGGRRCPCESSREGRDAHNARRRHNRALRSAAVEWAEGAGVPSTAVAVLAAAPPGVVAEWARQAGAPASVFDATHAKRLPERTISEAYWATPELVSAIAALSKLQGGIQSEAQLLGADVVEVDYVEVGGVNETMWVQLEGGIEGYHKAFTRLDDDTASDFGQSSGLQPIHEVSAWILARELGPPYSELMPPCVLRPVEGRLGSFGRRVAGDATSPLGQVPPQSIAAAAFFDALIAQQDRHGGNLLVDGASLHLIDHGFTYARPGDLENHSMFVGYRHRNGDPKLTDRERKALKRLVASPDIFGLSNVLETDRTSALVDRARRMLQLGEILRPGDY